MKITDFRQDQIDLIVDFLRELRNISHNLNDEQKLDLCTSIITLTMSVITEDNKTFYKEVNKFGDR